MSKFLAILVFVFIAGSSVGYGIGSEQPDCPSEDSCQVDYHDGHWTIIEVTP